MNELEQYEDEHFEYLDRLRASGVTNMYGATPYLVEEFGLTRDEAKSVLYKWMDTYSTRHPRKS